MASAKYLSGIERNVAKICREENEKRQAESRAENADLLETAARMRDIADGLRAENETLRDTVRELIDVDDCWYDHHDLCQAHSLHERPCPHQRAKNLLSTEAR